MNQITRAEQLSLPEQLYILLIDPDTGEPRLPRQRVERAIATSVLWELLHLGAFDTAGNTIVGVRQAIFSESYLRRAALKAAERAPVDGREISWHIAADLHPIWQVVGQDMVAKHLLTEEVQTRFVLFHKRVLVELGDARRDQQELSSNLAEAARNLWDPDYDAELARTHPRLLARLVLLDNNRLLEPLLGAAAYAAAAPHLAEIRAHLHQAVRDARAAPASALTGTDTSAGSFGDTCIYDSGSDFWIDTPDYADHGSHGHDGDWGSSHGDSSSSGSDWGGHDSGSSSSGGDWGGDAGSGDSGGGDCGGCGGCGG